MKTWSNDSFVWENRYSNVWYDIIYFRLPEGTRPRSAVEHCNKFNAGFALHGEECSIVGEEAVPFIL